LEGLPETVAESGTGLYLQKYVADTETADLVLQSDGYAVSRIVLSDQLKSLDWRTRKAKLIERISSDLMAMVTARVLPLLESDAPATL
jgi:mRNA-degrading endonuclease toxin of MazEF toxin-antitoxin module